MEQRHEDVIVDALNAFQSLYLQYNICTLSRTELADIIGESELVKLERLTRKISDADPTVNLLHPKSGEVESDIRFVLANQNLLDSFRQLNQAIRDDGLVPLKIVSAYRSQAYQLIILAKQIYDFDFDLERALRLVALPGDSEHQDPLNTAVDFDIVDDNDQRYAWLMDNASRYNFTLSFDHDNPQGMDFEPWHWRFGWN